MVSSIKHLSSEVKMAKTEKKKYVYFFGGGKAEGAADMKALLGGKGANLADMTSIGLPVPPGFTITTEACAFFDKTGGGYPEGMKDEVLANLKRLEELQGAKLGDKENPLLVSVRSGAAQSMPGMMDTVLNLGLNPDSLEALIKKTGNERFAWDSYRRFIQMFGDVVMGVEHAKFEFILQSVKDENGIHFDNELTVDMLKEVIKRYKIMYKKATGEDFPTDPEYQLFKAIDAVFKSWNNERAIKYRLMNDIRGLLGTAVNVQCMVFGNMGETSGTGVAFTRDPSTGENKFFGEYLMNAQGEDVVAGIRTPQSIDTLKNVNPDAYNQLVEIRSILEKHYKDMQDLEFTIQEGKLYMLQTRSGKRTIFSWLRSQVEMVDEGLIDKETAVSRVPAQEFNKLFAPILDNKIIRDLGYKEATSGLAASPGGACGQIYFTAKAAEEAASAEWAYTQADEALQAKFADIDKKIEEAEALKYAVKPVIDKVDAAIETYLSYEDKDAETLDDLKKDLNDALVWAEGEMYDAETALLKAQERQKKYANEEANAVTIAQEDLEEAENDLQEAQDELTAANEALLAEIDRISEQNEEVAE